MRIIVDKARVHDSQLHWQGVTQAVAHESTHLMGRPCLQIQDEQLAKRWATILLVLIESISIQILLHQSEKFLKSVLKLQERGDFVYQLATQIDLERF